VTVLLPYLIGAASAFAVQFLIQIYVVPRVETRKRREERWEKDVLDLGELLSTTVQEAAVKARAAQQFVRVVNDFPLGPDDSVDERDRILAQRQADALQDTRVFNDLVHFRTDWIADRITDFQIKSDKIFAFALASFQYQANILSIRGSMYSYQEMAEDDFNDMWQAEWSARTGMLKEIKSLARLRHPPRASLRRQIRHLKNTIKKRLRREPKPSEQEANDT
jgi:hypothetical protein